MTSFQEPLTTAMLAAAPLQEQKQMLGERIFPLIQVSSVPFVYFSFDSGESYGLYLKVNFNTILLSQRQHSDLAGKITGMLLEIDNSELLHMLEDPASLQAKVAICSVETPLHLVVFR